jgi:hypothetical protein
MMQDAARGTLQQRAAAYRHNRRMRKELLACMARWMLSCIVAAALTSYFQTLGAAGGASAGLFAVLAAAGGLLVTYEVCILTLGACIYLRLTYGQR